LQTIINPKSEYQYFVFDTADSRYLRVGKVCMRSLSAFVVFCLVALVIGCAPSKSVYHDMTSEEKDQVTKTAVARILEYYPPEQ
jgi:hypothetical protein